MKKNPASDAVDSRFIALTLALARRGLGRVWPNPAVGCVIVQPGAGPPGEGPPGEGRGAKSHIVGRGWTQPGGRPHAETEALARAAGLAEGATAYVSLEPCAHHGKTAPCCQALIGAGIKRVVIATGDPDPRVSGDGIAAMEKAGIEVISGVCAEEAEALNAGFFLRLSQGRPLVTLKLATTLDGRIATRRGESRWITGPQAREMVQGMRCRHDAVMVGSGTVLADDPKLNCHLPGLLQRSPLRVVMDSRLRLPLTSHLVRTAKEFPTWLMTRSGGDSHRLRAYRDCGVEVIEISIDAAGNLDAGAALGALGERGLTRVLVEGGSLLSAALLQHGLVDRLAWFHSPRVMGGDGIPAATAFGVDSLSATADFTRQSVIELDEDILETYTRRQ